MNEYRYEDIAVGMKESFSVTITDDMVSSFTQITGDTNPMHIDDAYARENGYQARIAYGLMTASFFSTLGGVYLPGKYCLFYENHNFFNKPVYIGDVLSVSGEVIEKSENSMPRITVKGMIKNQNNQTVCKAKLVLGVTK
jgi:3-hydroxybutyryl-CoA dehydratase